MDKNPAYIVLFLFFVSGQGYCDNIDFNNIFSVGKFKSCISTRDCKSNINCGQRKKVDTRNCRRTLIAGIKINAPSCEASKAAQNVSYQVERSSCEARKSAQKLDCERIKSQELMPCRIERNNEIESALEIQNKLEKLYEKAILTADRALPSHIVFKLSEKLPDKVLWEYRVNYSTASVEEYSRDTPINEGLETVKNIAFPRYRINTTTLNTRLIRSLLLSKFYDDVGIDGVSQVWLYEKETLNKYLAEETDSICLDLQCI